MRRRKRNAYSLRACILAAIKRSTNSAVCGCDAHLRALSASTRSSSICFESIGEFTRSRNLKPKTLYTTSTYLFIPGAWGSMTSTHSTVNCSKVGSTGSTHLLEHPAAFIRGGTFTVINVAFFSLLTVPVC